MVQLRMNGEFYGLFVEVEQPDKSFLKRSNLKGAAIYKASSPSERSDGRDLGNEKSFRENYEKETQKDEDFRDLQSFCHELATTKDVAAFFSQSIDLDEYVNYLGATALVQNWDAFNKNHFLVHDLRGSKKWLMIPWDLDRTLGDHWEGSFSEAKLPLRLGTAAAPGPTGWNRLFDKFFNNPALRTRFIDRLDALLKTEFTNEKLFPLLDRLESEIRADAALDRRRWPNRNADLRAGIAGVKRFIEDRRRYLTDEIKRQRDQKSNP